MFWSTWSTERGHPFPQLIDEGLVTADQWQGGASPKVISPPRVSPHSVFDSEYEVWVPYLTLGQLWRASSATELFTGLAFVTMSQFNSSLCPVLNLYSLWLLSRALPSRSSRTAHLRSCFPRTQSKMQSIFKLLFWAHILLFDLKLPVIFPFLFSYNRWESLITFSNYSANIPKRFLHNLALPTKVKGSFSANKTSISLGPVK